MKKILLLATLWLSFTQAKAQTGGVSYTYTSDSTILSVLFDNGFTFNNASPKFQINLKNRWKAKSNNKVSVTIMGSVTSFTPNPNLRFIIKLFGKDYTMPIVKTQNFEFTKEVLPSAIKNKPMIEIKVLNLKNKKDIDVTLDAIDITLKAESKK
jgi:hypothetical protein